MAMAGQLQVPVAVFTTQPHTRARPCRLAQSQPLRAAHQSSCRSRRTSLAPCRAQEADTSEVETASSTETASARPEGDWVPVIAPEEFPKGVRKEVRIDGVDVLIFWYRNNIYAIEARSPAEGAYSEGFISSKLNQDFCIECPSTGSTFDFRNGEIKDWYPSNFVLRFLTPKDTCRNLETYPVRLEQDAILIDVSGSAVFGRQEDQTRGGANTSAERNNVYGLEPKVYVESAEDRAQKSAAPVDAAGFFTTLVGITGAVGLAAAGTATAKYWQTDLGLYAFWAVYIVGGGVFAANKLRK